MDEIHGALPLAWRRTSRPTLEDAASAPETTSLRGREFRVRDRARYFFDQNRFRADWTSDVDAVGYVAYAAIDWYGAGATRYPIPGQGRSHLAVRLITTTR